VKRTKKRQRNVSNNKVSNADLMGVMMDIKQDLGVLKAKADGQTAWMTKHVADDAALAADVKSLQLGAARQKGFLTAVGAIGTVLGSAAGWFIERVINGGSHH
jgi:hypothetical protein